MRTFEEKMSDINKDQLLDRILHSGDFTALEKWYLEELVKAPPQKQGRWGSWSGVCTCTNCYTCYAVDLSNFSYCPSCGAEMIGGNERGKTNT